MHSRMSQSSAWPWILVGIHALLLIFFALNRYIEIFDEGFYLSAANAVAGGRTLYSDFFYPQMPYLPYVMSPFTGYGFATLYLTRLVSCLPAFASIVILLAILRTLSPNKVAITLALGLYAFSGLVLSSHTLIKAYSWTDMLLLVAFWSGVLRYSTSKRLAWVALVGFSVGLAVNFRLILAPAAIVLTIAVLKNSGSRKLAAAAVFALSVIAASIPTLLLLAGDPTRFIFDNIGFHLMRNPGVDFGASLLQRTGVVVRTILNPQVLILLALLAVWFLKSRPFTRRDNGRSLWSDPVVIGFFTMSVVVFVYLLPNPIHQQYFVQAVPFAVIVSIRGMEMLDDASRNFFRSISNRNLLRALGAVYMLGMIPYIVIFIAAVRGPDSSYKIGNIKDMCDYVNGTVPKGPVLSEWTGLPVLTNRTSFPGLEFTGFNYDLPLSDTEKRYYHFPVNTDLNEQLEQSIPAAYIVFNKPDTALEKSAARNYCLTRTFGVFNVYTRKRDSLCK